VKLTGQQIQQIQESLLSAFPSKDELSMMTRFQLSVSLDEIAGGENLRVIVFKLLTWSESNGRISHLIEGAYRQNPGNPKLAQLVQDARDWPALAKAPARQTNEPTLPPFLDFEWVRISAGKYTISKAALGPDAGKTVNLPEYYIAKRLVTNTQYKVFVDATWHKAPSYWRGGTFPPAEKDNPVVKVNWHDAKNFCEWARKEMAMEMHLPTEAEWEKAMLQVDADEKLWEWTRTQAGDIYLNWYVTRQGRDDSSARSDVDPNVTHGNVGFRCVVVPISC
jgi:formylglycine-generating enzyme required for sulfatase activity